MIMSSTVAIRLAMTTPTELPTPPLLNPQPRTPSPFDMQDAAIERYVYDDIRNGMASPVGFRQACGLGETRDRRPEPESEQSVGRFALHPEIGRPTRPESKAGIEPPRRARPGGQVIIRKRTPHPDRRGEHAASRQQSAHRDRLDLCSFAGRFHHRQPLVELPFQPTMQIIHHFPAFFTVQFEPVLRGRTRRPGGQDERPDGGEHRSPAYPTQRKPPFRIGSKR